MPLKRISDLPAGTYDNASLLEVSVPTGTTPPYASRKVTASDFAAPSFNNAGRNYVMNSQFNIAQRGTGPWTTNVYTADRWIVTNVGGTMSTSIVALNDANRAQIGDEAAVQALSLLVAGTSGASDEAYVQQLIEGVRRTAGKTITLSFWAAANAGTPKLGIMLYQAFGTGGSPSAVVVLPGQAITLSTAYTRYSLIFSIPSVAGKTFGTTAGTDLLTFRFGMSAGATTSPNYGGIGVQSGTFTIWGVQLEIGSVATPLEKPDPADDLARCQRFYQTGFASQVFGVIGAGSSQGSYMAFPVLMRASPTMAVTGTPAYGNATAASIADITVMGFTNKVQAVASASGYGVFTWSASADL
jgi:hypothetical protein